MAGKIVAASGSAHLCAMELGHSRCIECYE